MWHHSHASVDRVGRCKTHAHHCYVHMDTPFSSAKCLFYYKRSASSMMDFPSEADEVELWDLLCLISQGDIQYPACNRGLSPGPSGVIWWHFFTIPTFSMGLINRCWRSTSEMWSLARIFKQIKMVLLSGPQWFPTHFLCIPNFLFYIYHVYLLKMSPSSAQEETLWPMWCLYDPGVCLRVSSHQLCVFGSSRWRPICLQPLGADESPEFHSFSPIWKWLSSRDLDLVCHISPCLC